MSHKRKETYILSYLLQITYAKQFTNTSYTRGCVFAVYNQTHPIDHTPSQASLTLYYVKILNNVTLGSLRLLFACILYHLSRQAIKVNLNYTYAPASIRRWGPSFVREPF